MATYPVSVTGDDAPARTTSPPAWVTPLRAVDKAAPEAAYRKAMDQSTSAGDMLLFTGFMLLMAVLGLFGLLAPAWGLRRWHGGRRISAAAAVVVTALVVLRILVHTARDPTSHTACGRSRS